MSTFQYTTHMHEKVHEYKISNSWWLLYERYKDHKINSVLWCLQVFTVHWTVMVDRFIRWRCWRSFPMEKWICSNLHQLVQWATWDIQGECDNTFGSYGWFVLCLLCYWRFSNYFQDINQVQLTGHGWVLSNNQTRGLCFPSKDSGGHL